MDDSIIQDSSMDSESSINIDETLITSDSDIIENSEDESATLDSSADASVGDAILNDSNADDSFQSIDNSLSSSGAPEQAASRGAHNDSSQLETSEIKLSDDESHAASDRLSTSATARKGSSNFETSEMNLSGNELGRLSNSVITHEESSKFETSEINLSDDDAVKPSTSNSKPQKNVSDNKPKPAKPSNANRIVDTDSDDDAVVRQSKSVTTHVDSSKFETSEINLSDDDAVKPSKFANVLKDTSNFKPQTKASDNKPKPAKPSTAYRIVDTDSDDDLNEIESSKIYTIESSDDESPIGNSKPVMAFESSVKSEPGMVKEGMMGVKLESARPIVKFESSVKSEPILKQRLMSEFQSGAARPIGKAETNVKSDLYDDDEEELPSSKLQSDAQSGSSKLNASQLVDDVKPTHLGKTGMETFNYQQSMALNCMSNLSKALEVKPDENKMADNPKQLKIELMPHQRIALTWMLWREEQRPKGGILADDMGLGKTMSMISLILAKMNMDTEDEAESSDSEDDDDRVEGGKSSWIAKGSSSKSNYYGGTLVVCPASIIYQWQAEVANRVKRNAISVVLHHGSNRETKARLLSKADLVITTYGIVSSENDNQGVLFSIKWERIILDEAHIIRNHTSKQSLACCKLRSSARWVLTGTPIQNKEMDLFPLLKFLKCRPFDDLSSFKMWISKTSSKAQERLNQVLQALLLRRTKEDLKQIGQIESLPDKTRVIVPVQLSTDEMSVYQKVLIYSQSLFTEYLHQKETRNNFSMEVDTDRKNQFTQLHQQISRATGNSEAISGHHILILILRLRQICIHPSLINAMLSDADGDLDSGDSDGENAENEPEIDLIEKLSKLNVGSNDEDDETVSKASSKVLLRSNPVFDEQRISSKFQKIIEYISEKLIGSGDKGIVVSQFASVLNMFGDQLKLLGIRFVTLTGQTKIDTRNDIVTKFNDAKSSVQVMLLSLTAGGVGLNLVGANHLFFVDPHWNPQLESQAQDRIYRLGQKKPVTIYKFLCDDTIERKIEKIQENKLQIANQVLTGAKRKTVKLTLDDMKSLFDL